MFRDPYSQKFPKAFLEGSYKGSGVYRMGMKVPSRDWGHKGLRFTEKFGVRVRRV